MRLSLEDEFAHRWKNKKIKSIYEDIMKTFGGKTVQHYSAGFALNEKDSIVFLNTRGDLHNYLVQNLNNKVFYDTNDKNIIEMLTFYEFNAYHLG